MELMGQNQRRMFRPVRQVAVPVRRQTTLFEQVRQVAAPGWVSAISNCILFFIEASVW